MTTAEVAGPKITVLGSANMDLVTTTERLPMPGETVLGATFATIPGGKGLNQAIAVARAGGEVEFIGAVGDDTFALELRETLVLNDVGTELLREVEGPSGVAMITVNRSGENSIIVVADANASLLELTEQELEAIADADTLVCQLEIPLETVLVGVKHARAHGTAVLLNPSPVQELPPELLTCVDVLVLNHLEAEQLGKDVLASVPHVITTLGPAGVSYRGPDGEQLAAESVPVEAVDTTGAGDAFVGALAVAWSRGPEHALMWACAAGALATTVPGASTSMPTAEQIEAALTLTAH
ncbi:ribokinase [Antrihabitans sp. YC2-6]|uniref:ribokinase n=1 Tax=Antrihabitans sp. YC2-6 TaxID=2799498 RepID=UPI0018F538B1|nr:ribokinase [Antrihabitans sp. YC2-6]MBJ8346817.1 ribokinase [Antrihabitans sp. YC2-6]